MKDNNSKIKIPDTIYGLSLKIPNKKISGGLETLLAKHEEGYKSFEFSNY